MDAPDRRQLLLTMIAAQLELARAEQCLQKSKIALDKPVSEGTVRNILRARDHRIGSLVDVADAMNLEVEIRFVKKSA